MSDEFYPATLSCGVKLLLLKTQLKYETPLFELVRYLNQTNQSVIGLF